MWGFTEQDLGARRRPPNPFELELPEAQVFRGSIAPGRLAQRRHGDRITHASLHHGLSVNC